MMVGVSALVFSYDYEVLFQLKELQELVLIVRHFFPEPFPSLLPQLFRLLLDH